MSNPQIDEWYELGTQERRDRRQAGRRRRRRLPAVLRRGSPTAARTRWRRPASRRCASASTSRAPRCCSSMSLPVAILAGGLATRLRPRHRADPKALVDVAGRPFAEHQLELLARTASPTSCSASAISASMVEDALGDGCALGMQVRYVVRRPDAARHRRRAAAAPAAARRRVLRALRRLVSASATTRRSSARFARAASRPDDRLPQRRRWDRSNVVFADGRIVALRQDGAARRRCATSTTASACFRTAAFDAVSGRRRRSIWPTSIRICSPADELPATRCRTGSTRSARRPGWRKRARHLATQRTADPMSYAAQHLDETAQIIDGLDAAAIERSWRLLADAARARRPAVLPRRRRQRRRTARTRSTTSARSPASRPTRRPTTCRS